MYMAKFGNLTYTVTLSFVNGRSYRYTQSSHDIEFDIQRGVEFTGSTAVVKIANIPQSQYTEYYSPAVLYRNSLKGVMQFSLGRVGAGEYIVFEKDIFSVDVDFSDNTVWVVFHCMAGAFALKQVRSVSSPKTTLKQFLIKLATENNFKVGKIEVNDTVFYDLYFPNSKIANIISYMKKQFSIDIWVDNNTLNARDLNELETVVTRGFIITQEQLMGVPKPTEKGIKFQTHLDPRLEVSQSVTLQSSLVPKLNGNYLVRSVRHTGNIALKEASNGKTEIELLYFNP